MAGYSETPLPRKLGIKDGDRLALLDAPAGLDVTLGALPNVATVRTDARAKVDVAVCFVTARAALERRFDPLKRAIFPHGGLWIAWPKRSAGKPTDLTEDVVREVALERGLVDNKVCAIDETWSGLRLVYRVADRRR
jgi:hypothetical protein